LLRLQQTARVATDMHNSLVENLRDIPVFKTEVEEAEYWSTHTFGDQILADMVPAREADPRLPAPRPLIDG